MLQLNTHRAYLESVKVTPEFVFLLFPLAVTPGNWYLACAAVLAAVFFAVSKKLQEGLSAVKIPYFYSWFLLLAWGLYVTLKTPSLTTGFKYFAGTYVFPFFLFIILYNIRISPRFLTSFFNMFFVSGLVLCFFSVYTFYIYKFQPVRIPSLWNDFNIVSAYYMILFMFSLSFVLNSKRTAEKYMYMIPLACSILGVYLTQTRGVWLSIAVAIPLFFLKKPRIIVPALLLIGVVIFFFYNVIENRLLSVMNFQQDKSSVGRLQAWISTAIMIKNYPWLGYGFDTYILFRDQVLPYYVVPVPHPHNTYLRTWQETGLIGFVLYYYFFIKAFFKTVAVKKNRLYGDYVKFIDGLQLSLIGLSIAFMFEPYLSLFGSIAIVIWALVSLSFRITDEINAGNGNIRE